MISTKGRYSIRVLLDLAEHRSGDFIPMKEVAARQDISLKYIERLMPALKAAGLVESVHGIGGGYRLTREPEDYTLWEILELAEGNLAPVTCLQPDAPVCQRAGECRTLGVWQGFYKLTQDYFTHITLADLMNARGRFFFCLFRADRSGIRCRYRSRPGCSNSLSASQTRPRSHLPAD